MLNITHSPWHQKALKMWYQLWVMRRKQKSHSQQQPHQKQPSGI
jgi:hypothetical protein